MEKSGSRELRCVGKLEIERPKPVGFLCGSIPVPTDKPFHSFHSALIPSPQTVSAPRYRMLPTETDLNSPPLLSSFPDKILPVHSGDKAWDGGAVTSNLARKCEALAVSGLVEYGDEIDVIAPADILKQIFKMPYSKARLSIAVQRIGHTLILNTGPDVEEGEKLIRRRQNQSKCLDQSLFLNFAMHSVRVEACDCPPTHNVTSHEQSNASVLPGVNTGFVGQRHHVARGEETKHSSEYTQVKQDEFVWASKKNKNNTGHNAVKKASQVGDKPVSSMQESEKHKRGGDDEFLRVLFWQFHNFRMLLGSDLLLFSNEKYVAVSLHLWDVSREVKPITWLEAWLDNVMASVPEMAICYHKNGVVHSYELLKTDDIFLLKGISDDGTPAFHPYVVQQNGLAVLRFLQENCKQDPGAYWLYKSAGENDIQLFDLSVIPKNHSSDDCDDSSSSLSSLLHRRRSDSLYSLGTLLYRSAHRLSLSMAPNNVAKCARFFRKCLELLDEPNHLVVRASAHEQFARLILNNDDELELTSDALPAECELTVSHAQEESIDFLSSISESLVHDQLLSLVGEEKSCEDGPSFQDIVPGASVNMTVEANAHSPRKLITGGDMDFGDLPESIPNVSCDERFTVCKLSPTTTDVVQSIAEPISSKLAAIHHVAQAIKSLRWMRQLHITEPKLVGQDSETQVESSRSASSVNLSVCACGDADCIEVCDIREWLPTSKLDHKLWKLVLLLGESYLALGQAYLEDDQLHQALKVVELACSVYGSMPQHLEDTKFISSMNSCWSSKSKNNNTNKKTRSYNSDQRFLKSSNGDCLTFEQFSSIYLFWAKAWILVGDVYVEFHKAKDSIISEPEERKHSTSEVKVSSEVVKEVKRLKRKLGQHVQNCTSCSLVNCSCQSDRASSGSSASSSSGPSGDMRSVSYGRKCIKKPYPKSNTYPHLRDLEDSLCLEAENKNILDVESTVVPQCDVALKKTGGIFKYLGGPAIGDVEYNLSAALCCYEEARKALGGFPSSSEELQSVMKKKGWVCNELGRNRLARKELSKAESAFIDAIKSFREVSDHTNIVLINCNLGHGRRAVAEEVVSKIDGLKMHSTFPNAYVHALETAKLEYSESLKFYGAAKAELSAFVEDPGSVLNDLRTEVCTQFAHTYLRLGMLLAREDITVEVYGTGVLEDMHTGSTSPTGRKSRKESRKHEISANDAIRKALSVYESLGELRKQEAAYAYYQLACYQRDCCLKFLEPDQKKSNLSIGENSILQRVKQYASLAERNWQKAMGFYGPKTHPTMYLTILIERSELSLKVSSPLHSNVMLESAVSCLLEGRYVSSETDSDSLKSGDSEVHANFWNQLQMVLKKMLAVTLSAGGNKLPVSQPRQLQTISNRSGDAEKLRELYKISLKCTELSQLCAMHNLWTS
ncbi:hypothetical protein ABKV19_017308 [Rosa sericea]